jgi:hypothetical protein
MMFLAVEKAPASEVGRYKSKGKSKSKNQRQKPKAKAKVGGWFSGLRL